MVVTPQNNTDARPGYPPTGEDTFWVEAMRQVLFDAMAGNQKVAAIIAGLSGIAVLGYAGWLLSPWFSGGIENPGKWLLLLAPIVIWSLAFFYATLVFQVRRYRYFANSPDSSRLAFKRINRKRGEYLSRACICWFVGTGALLIVIILR